MCLIRAKQGSNRSNNNCFPISHNSYIRPVVRKPTTILLLLILVVQLVGVHLYFSFARWKVKAEMHEKIASGFGKEHLRTIRVRLSHANELPSWFDKHEFSYEGQMYDVISFTVKDKELVISCISDKDETRLIDLYHSLAKKDFGNKNNSRKGTVVKLFSSLFSLDSFSFEIESLLPGSQQNGFYLVYIPDVSSEIITPPPRLS